MVATADRRDETQDITGRAESPPGSGFVVIGQYPALHLIRERRRARRERSAAEIRAMAVWPRLDPSILYRCQGDADRLARAIARHRTTMSVEHVRRILTGEDE
jgi:hypothetical protein